MYDITCIAAKLARVLDSSLITLGHGVRALSIGTELWAFVDRPDIDSLEKLRSDPELSNLDIPDDASIVRFVLPKKCLGIPERARIRLGYEVVTARVAIHQILDLPDTFLESQRVLVEEALSPVAGLEGGPIEMRGFAPQYMPAGNAQSAATTLLSWIDKTDNSPLTQRLIFVEAEAGKGKTILLASTARIIARSEGARLAVYIPLRRLPLETGIGWDNIMQVIGVVGVGAERLASAVKNGVVVLFLDGIDEVSGRYDRQLIKDLLKLLSDRLTGPDCVAVLSGRKTEARELDLSHWRVLGIELPSASSGEFRRYVEFVMNSLIDDWDQGIESLSGEFANLLGAAKIDLQVRREKQDIADWIVDVFPVVGKDASLFFVQGLAAIGIGRRAGNRFPLCVNGTRYIPSALDVCKAAAVFACLRERLKVDSIAEEEYSVERQMAVLLGFALLASSASSAALAGLPTPNELAARAFNVDPINASEEYVAITRQNAKHALLYATEAAGHYRPKFLSDWIRCAFLAQALRDDESVGGIDVPSVIAIIALADRARYTYSSLLPDILDGERVPRKWIDALIAGAENGAETASSNIWQLRAAVGDERIGTAIPNPLPLAQIDQAEFAGSEIGQELSGEAFFLDDTIFEGATISGVSLEGVSMIGVEFRACVIERLYLSKGCEGPVHFEGCVLRDCKFESMIAGESPALSFVDCAFEGSGNCVTQDSAAFGETVAKPLVEFDGCVTDGPLGGLLVGDWVHVSMPPDGIRKRSVVSSDPIVDCLQAALRTFFPTRMGNVGDLQARPYIRLSALGRGRMPEGAPGRDELQRIFETVGFATGGRPDHLYAPWASVLGGGEDARRVREEMIDFMHDSSCQGPIIGQLLSKIKRAFV